MDIGFDMVQIPDTGQFCVRIMIHEDAATYVLLVRDEQAIQFADEISKSVKEVHYKISEARKASNLIVPNGSLIVPSGNGRKV